MNCLKSETHAFYYCAKNMGRILQCELTHKAACRETQEQKRQLRNPKAA